MKAALILLSASILILLLIWWRSDIWFSNSTVDIRHHDTYFVIANFHFVFFVLLFLGTFYLLGTVLGTKFRNKIFIVLPIIFLVVDVYIFWNLYSSFHHSQNFAQLG